MSDIQIIKDQISGLIAKGQELRKKEAIFLKIQGINEEIEKTNLERSETKTKLAKEKKKLKGLIVKKNVAVAGSTEKIAEKMKEVLPVGDAVFDVSDGLSIGWKDLDTVPYNGLSGCQKQIFDTALAHVLDSNIIVLEAAELDVDHLAAALEDLALMDKQVIVNTCHPVITHPKAFKLVLV